ncbi:MAG TPA: hypothetical protein VK942_10085 [Actinomycetes bacterium]|nr:hypothetical protein [Actinomycetes bacterium]
MANQVMNIARGKIAYYYYAVENSLVVTAAGTPALTSTANAALIVLFLETTGLEADDVLNNYDDLAALLAAANNEQTNQARKVLTDTDLAAVPAPNDTANTLNFIIPDIVWTALAGNLISKLLVCFRPNAAAGDSAIVPLTYHDFVVIPDGTDVTADVSATLGFYQSG